MLPSTLVRRGAWSHSLRLGALFAFGSREQSRYGTAQENHTKAHTHTTSLRFYDLRGCAQQRTTTSLTPGPVRCAASRSRPRARQQWWRAPQPSINSP